MNSWQQPVAGQASLGTGHWTGDNLGSSTVLDQNTATVDTWYTVTFSSVPNGTKAVWAFVLINTANDVTKSACITRYDDTGSVAIQYTQLYIIGTYIGGLCRFPLDSSKRAKIACRGEDCRIRVWEPLFQDI